MTDKTKQAIAALEADGWKRRRSLPQLGRWIFEKKSNRPGYIYEYRTVFRRGRIVPGAYEQ